MMPKNVHAITWVVDLSDCSLSLELVTQLKDLFLQVADFYCERLSYALVVNSSWTMNFVWNFVKMFLDPSTVAKYVFISGSSKQLRKSLLQHVDEEHLLEEYQGKAKYKFNMEALLSLEKKAQAVDQEHASEEVKEVGLD